MPYVQIRRINVTSTKAMSAEKASTSTPCMNQRSCMFLVAILGFAAQSIAEFIASYPANAKTLRADATCEFFTVGTFWAMMIP